MDDFWIDLMDDGWIMYTTRKGSAYNIGKFEYIFYN